MKNDFQKSSSNLIMRLSLLFSIFLFHSVCYYLVNHFTSLRSTSAFLDFHTTIDNWIPYLPWTWIFYYLAYVYIIFWAAIIVCKLPELRFRGAIYAYVGIITLGAVVQLTLPGKAPWLSNMTSPQRLLHNLITRYPYGCFPSMHVALTILPTCMGLRAFDSRWLKILSIILAILIIISTLTLKEHYFLDVLTGMLLGLFFSAFWYWDFNMVFRRFFARYRLR